MCWKFVYHVCDVISDVADMGHQAVFYGPYLQDGTRYRKSMQAVQYKHGVKCLLRWNRICICATFVPNDLCQICDKMLHLRQLTNLKLL